MKIFCYLVFVSLLVACNIPSARKQKTALATKLDHELDTAVGKFGIVGLTVAATRNDSVVYTGTFGYRNLATKEPMKVTYDFHWASVSKTFVATAVMQLVEQKKIDLNEKLIHYLPYFSQKKGDYKAITIRQMLNHTSGIGDVDDYEWDKPQNDDAAPERYVKSLAKDTMLFAPGKGWAYSNTAFEILGVVISKVSGLSFEDYMRRYIFQPLAMTNSSFSYPEIPDSIRVSGHVFSDRAEVSKVYPYNRIHAPSSTLNTNVIDMTHYAMAQLHHGEYLQTRILSDSSYNLLWTNSVNLEGKPAVGISWFIDEYKGLKTVSHGGGDTGFRSYLLLVPEKNISVELVSNYEKTETRQLALGVLDLILADGVKK